MSMNLNCNLVELRQTPTQVTHTCMVQPNGVVPLALTGVKAKHALWIYIQWLRGTLNGEYASSEDADCARQWVIKEAAAITAVMGRRGLKVNIF